MARGSSPRFAFAGDGGVHSSRKLRPDRVVTPADQDLGQAPASLPRHGTPLSKCAARVDSQRWGRFDTETNGIEQARRPRCRKLKAPSTTRSFSRTATTPASEAPTPTLMSIESNPAGFMGNSARVPSTIDDGVTPLPSRDVTARSSIPQQSARS